jgi:hypothetical protein
LEVISVIWLMLNPVAVNMGLPMLYSLLFFLALKVSYHMYGFE